MTYISLIKIQLFKFMFKNSYRDFSSFFSSFIYFIKKKKKKTFRKIYINYMKFFTVIILNFW